MHIAPMLRQMILAREAMLADAAAPLLGAVVAWRVLGEVRGCMASQVVGAGELARARRVQAVVGCWFGCGGGGGGVRTVGRGRLVGC